MTHSGEALQDGSPENAELRDHLAELWLKTVKEAKQVGLPMLQMRAWLLLPGSELAQQRFWAPFYQKVSCGLREVPLVPVRGSAELLPMSRCRKPDSHLLASLDLGPKQLEQLGLGIPTEVAWSKLRGRVLAAWEGIAEEPPSNPPATPEMRGMVGMASPDPGMEGACASRAMVGMIQSLSMALMIILSVSASGAGPEDIFKVKEEVEDRDTSVACGGVVLSSRRGSASAKPTLAPAVNGSAAGHSGGKVKREEDGARGAPSVPLPQLRDQASDGNLFDHGPATWRSPVLIVDRG
eukprot:Skav225385  [mRNA]  locus=scaffold2656:68893:77684:+ [translate_table: standard]